MANDILQSYLQQIGRYPLLSRAEEVQLAKRIEAGDEGARRRMIESNLRLVFTIARDFQGRGVDLLDLVQEGTLGLMKAVERYDWRREVKFSTYAAWWIRSGITDAIGAARPIRLPESILDRISSLRAAETELTAQLGRRPTSAELAGELGLTTTQIDEALVAMLPVSSLEEPWAAEDTPRMHLLPDPNAVDPAATLFDEPRAEELRRHLAALPERGRRVIELRFGLVDGVTRTADEIAEQLGVTRERVRQIELQALSRVAAAARTQTELAAVA
jgi:RNA polymerase primary sigma factor